MIWIPMGSGGNHLEYNVDDLVLDVVEHNSLVLPFGAEPVGVVSNDGVVDDGRIGGFGQYGLDPVLRSLLDKQSQSG